ncbi:serine/threonine-protein phosphatase 4 regulatory subunit 1 isoform X3 [Cryptotermes secundus]|nr:serine/threonine-protein phosphatase 4 regulatory subunit 1 isoform X3 [Cryptotermes secundus]
MSDSEVRTGNKDDFLPPLVRLEKCSQSISFFDRRMVGRLVLETLPAVADDPADVASVMAIIEKVATDCAAPVRAELMTQVPHIAMLCHEDKNRLRSLVLDHLLPLVVRHLGDNDSLVRKMSQAALLLLVKQDLVGQSEVEQKVCPMILKLTEMGHPVEFHTGAVALMSKMARLIGRSSTERLFLSHFAAACSDPVFYVRKACAANFGEFCAVIGTESTESVLLARFLDLCGDEIWGVRKACAEVFMSVSCTCTLQTRKKSLAPVFANLLVDQCRWVRLFAYKTLGPFISTFADPSIIRLSYNQNGKLVILGPDGFEYSQLVPLGVSGVDCTKFLPEFNCGPGTLNPNDTNYNVNRDMGEISSHADESSEDTEMSVIYDYFGDEESSCCDVESGVNSLVQCSTVNKCISVPSACDERTVGTDAYSVVDNISEVRVRDTVEGECVKEEIAEVRWAPETGLTVEEGCLSDESSSTSETGLTVEEGCLSDESSSTGEQNTIGSSGQIVETGSSNPNLQQLCVSESEDQAHIHVESSTLNSVEAFNTFQYWRVPIPELELDFTLAETDKSTAQNVRNNIVKEALRQLAKSRWNVNKDRDSELENLSTRREECSLQYPAEAPHNAQICTASVAMVTETATVYHSRNYEYKRYKSRSSFSEIPWEGLQRQHLKPMATVQPLLPQVNQDIVPQWLIDHFVSMTHPSQAKKTDYEIVHYCAFSLPAVALTLGRDNWVLLKDAHETLASHMQWTVRLTVASSIHELAVILGEDLATKDLVPVFNGFIKDLDEVRIGALRHLAEFLKLLRPPDRNVYLPRLSEFLVTDNEWNWRFREELADQLLAAVSLFTPEDTRKHLTPIAISLLLDKVAAVRQVSLCLVTELVKHVSADPLLLRGLIGELAEWFAHSKRWIQRQTFALLCSQLVTKRILLEELFARDILPHLLDLSWDPVPNVRLCVARTLATNIMAQQFFSSAENPHHEVLIQVLKRLQGDNDRDVRYFASLFPSSTGIEDSSTAENS